MSTTYRVIIHCDENDSSQCHGLLEISDKNVRFLSSTHSAVEGRGWLRGYAADDTYDVCPACRPKVEARLPNPAPERGLTDG